MQYMFNRQRHWNVFIHVHVHVCSTYMYIYTCRCMLSCFPRLLGNSKYFYCSHCVKFVFFWSNLYWFCTRHNSKDIWKPSVHAHITITVSELKGQYCNIPSRLSSWAWKQCPNLMFFFPLKSGLCIAKPWMLCICYCTNSIKVQRLGDFLSTCWLTLVDSGRLLVKMTRGLGL